MSTLTKIYDASVSDATHVIFVHGLGGDAHSTWMNNANNPSTFWPGWVGEDAKCCVWVADYGAAISGWTDDAMHLADLGEALFAALQVEQSLQSSRIVLVGHSLGGLIIKSGMTQAQSLGDPKRLALLKRIGGVVFIGTPHQGASLATVAHNLRLLLKTNAQVTNMVKNDAWLKLLNGQFRALYEQHRFGVRVFFESKAVFIGHRFFGIPIGKRILIVDRNSSDPGLAEVVPTAIEGDHIEIAKPKSRKTFIHKAIVEFLKEISARSANNHLKGEASTYHWCNSTDLPTKLRNASVPLLSWPNTLADGTWLIRPELDVLTSSLAAEPSSTHFLLGDPGCGKSSLLVRLAQERQAAGWSILAIKADRLPPEILDQKALAKHLSLGTDTGVVLKELAKSEPVLVLIDQVDALADLVVQHSARLRVLLDLVQDLSGVEGVHIVISCRTFEQQHDPALRNLDADIIRLELPEWSAVQQILTTRGLQAEAWNQDIQQVLRSPHALEIFLSLLGNTTEPEVLKSFQGLLEKQWETQVLSDTSGSRRTTLHHLAKLMADREVLGLPLAQVEKHYDVIQALSAAGLLRVDKSPGRVEFRHQTLYEFVRARSFLEDSGSLTEAVQTHQVSLRIRPQLWHALGYFRGVSPEEYSIEIGKLWAAELRPHLRMLLIEFLGLQTTPLFAERRLVEQSMSDPWFLSRFIGAAAGSPGWFDALLPAHLPRLMDAPVEQAQKLLPLLRHALHFNSEEVVALVRRHWMKDADRDVLSWQVLGSGDIAPQLGPWFDSLTLIAARSQIAEWAISITAGVVSAAHPEAAPKLVAAWLKRQLDSAAVPEEDKTTKTDSSRDVLSVLEARQFHDMEAIAEVAPKAFIEALWPVLLEALQQISSESQNIVISYRKNSGLWFEDFDEDGRLESPLLRAVQVGLQEWANNDPDNFLEFIATNEQSDLIIVHRLLALGLLRCVGDSPQHVFNYLCGDPRRLALGPYSDIHKESIALLKAVCPQLNDTDYTEIEEIIRDYRLYNEVPPAGDADTRHKRIRWSRQHRLRLLRGLPSTRRSAAIQRLIDEEERAFPDLTDWDVNFSGVRAIESPVSASQMDRATEANILNLFDELTDETCWNHPRDRMKGGALEAGREFAELAKSNLPKVMRLIRLLTPGRNEIPVSNALRNLVPAGLPAPELYSLITELEDKGFTSSDFRHNAAYTIVDVASKESPVPDELLVRMERWLVSAKTEDDTEIEPDTQEDSSSVLWGHGSMSVLPGGNYPTLCALTMACLTSVPPRLDLWLSILERHTKRPESSRVWKMMLQRELRNLRMTDCSKGETLVEQLIVSIPSILNSHSWAHFVAHAFHWASPSAAQRWLIATIEQGGRAQLAAGELACLRHALFPAEDWPRELVKKFIQSKEPKGVSGVAHGVANLWHEPMTRPIVHPILLQLLHSTDENVLIALSTTFLNDGFSADVETQELMDCLIANPQLLKFGQAEQLPELLAKLVTYDPQRVSQMAHALLNTVGDKMGNMSTSWYLSTEWLLDIALQLQDMGPDERVSGLELFERMLEFNMPQAKEMTLDMDKRTPVGCSPRASVRRRSRRPRCRKQ
ncbi:hypothetical protein HMPREF1170_02126 [Aeromonas veronii AMC35]|uniref:alpha/beta fold hydrolase n=1 Tax=Aeromonas TaxID=642 RepID=UPI0002806CF4|nr:alpha/beta fold hydrolase [Aeromonas veronii]EKB21864.1 hypothetical protein HMPREF1170_02126 [Aeromonas veronii AMC35]